jgi:hypothetical protein
MRIKVTAAIAVLAFASSAFAVFNESEPNDTILTADPIALTCSPASADIGFGALVPADHDIYSVFVPSGCILTAITTPYGSLPGNFSSPDTLLAVLNPGGALIIENDDAGTDGVGGGGVGPVRGSAVRYLNTGPDDTYYLRVRGFLENQTGPYALTVSLFPEPATIGLLLGGLAFAARRRK